LKRKKILGFFIPMGVISSQDKNVRQWAGDLHLYSVKPEYAGRFPWEKHILSGKKLMRVFCRFLSRTNM
jgi:hypothetical protein